MTHAAFQVFSVMPRLLAPELDAATDWLNAPEPVSLARLRGSLVLLVFFRSDCIECAQSLPLLARLERRRAAAETPSTSLLTIIGIDGTLTENGGRGSGRTPARAHVRTAWQALAIDWPVACDGAGHLWARYQIHTCPTVVLVHPDGLIGAVAPGEPDPVVLEQLLVAAGGAAATGPDAVNLARAGAAEDDASAAVLRFPGAVAIAPNGRLAVADTGHHRVIIADPSGQVLQIAGCGIPGHRDGPFATAQLRRPRGLAWDGEVLWLCDAGNHTLVRIDLLARTLATVAGTGHLGDRGLSATQGAQPADRTPLRSPWDVVVDDTRLYLSLAGAHQIAIYDKQKRTLAPLAGCGKRGIEDGAAFAATFSQPTGILLEGDVLYVADSDSGLLRRVQATRGLVESVVAREHAGSLALATSAPSAGPAASSASAIATTSAAPSASSARASGRRPLAMARRDESSLFVIDSNAGELLVAELRHGSVMPPGRSYGRLLHHPEGVALMASGNLVVADTHAHRLALFTSSGRPLGSLPIRWRDDDGTRTQAQLTIGR